jgi:hypothetical protein
MGRTYAGILGPLAFATVLFRGLILVDATAPTLKLSMICLFAFAIVGFVIGKIAEMTVLESVKAKIGTEMQASKDDASTVTTS